MVALGAERKVSDDRALDHGALDLLEERGRDPMLFD